MISDIAGIHDVANQHVTNAASQVVAVIMERRSVASRWFSEMWVVKGVVPDPALLGMPRSVIVHEPASTQILFPGHKINLQRGEAEGLNSARLAPALISRSLLSPGPLSLSCFWMSRLRLHSWRRAF